MIGEDEDGVGRTAQFRDPISAVIMPDRSCLIVADAGNNALRRISLLAADYGTVSTLSGRRAMDMLNEPRAAALWNYLCAVVISGCGRVVVADHDNFRL